jgi:hypothetical protein
MTMHYNSRNYTEIMDTTVEGWDEDEDILLDEIESSSPVGKEAVPVTVPIIAVAPPPQKSPVSTSTAIHTIITASRSNAAPAVMAPPAAAAAAAAVQKELIQIANDG